MMRGKVFAPGVFAIMTAAATPAQAALVIADKPSKNISCFQESSCWATASDAVMNVRHLTHLLRKYYDVGLDAGGVAKTLVVDAAFSWSNKHHLSLSAPKSIFVDRSITVAANGSLDFNTHNGELVIRDGAKVDIWDKSAQLCIGLYCYTLEHDLQSLAADIASNPGGHFALARDYDASADGIYASTVIGGSFFGAFHGLGHTISNLSFAIVVDYFQSATAGLFNVNWGTLSDITLANTNVTASGNGDYHPLGALASENSGTIERAAVLGGSIVLPDGDDEDVGGIAGGNFGTIASSQVSMTLSIGGFAGFVGGITAANAGIIQDSFVSGSIAAAKNNYCPGGIAGYNAGIIKNTYSLAKITQLKGIGDRGYFGGLVGDNGGSVSLSYAAGRLGPVTHGNIGGVVGFEQSAASLSHTYWDVERSAGKGAGNEAQVSGATGLSTSDLQSALPAGFDKRDWAQNPAINAGLPYLIDNPPR